MGVHINPFTGKLDVVDSPSGDFSDLTLDLGTEAAPSISFDGDPNTGIYSPGADQLAISTNGTGRLFVDSSGRVGVGSTSPGDLLHVMESSASAAAALTASVAQFERNGACAITISSTNTTTGSIFFGDDASAGIGRVSFDHSDNSLQFWSTLERARIDSSGRLLVGTSSTSASAFLTIQGNSASSTGGASIYLQRGSANPSGTLASINFADSNEARGALIYAATDGTWATDDYPTALVFSTTADGASSPTERMRIDSAGSLLHGASSAPSKISQPCLTSPNYSGYFIRRVTTSGTVYSGVNRTVTLTFPDVNTSNDFAATGQIEASIMRAFGISSAAGSPNISYVKRIRDFITTTEDTYTSDPTPQQVWLNSTLDMTKGSGVDITFSVSGRVVTIVFSNSATAGQAQYGTVVIKSNVQPIIATA